MMVKWMSNIKSENKSCAEELPIRLKLNSMWKCLQDRRMELFGHLD